MEHLASAPILTHNARLLIRAATARGDAAVTAWREWVGGPQPPATDPTLTLLPSVYANLRRQQAAPGDLAPTLPHYQRAAAQALRLMRVVPAVAAAAARVGSATMLLKGSAILAAHQADWGARLIGDVDVLVPEQYHALILRDLFARGWRDKTGLIREQDMRFSHAASLLDDHGVALDLHAHALHERCEPGADRRYWEQAQPAQVGTASVLVPCPADLLCTIAIHGTRPGPSHIRWVTDAVTLVRGGVDWPRVSETAAATGLAPIVGAALDLAREFEPGIPLETIATLKAAPADERARAAWEIADVPTGDQVLSLRSHWLALTGGVGSRNPVKLAAALPRYLEMKLDAPWWNLPWAIPLRLARKAARRFARRSAAPRS